MLYGNELGRALASAMQQKGVSPTQLAKEFGVKPPSVHGWIKTGRIHKKHLPDLLTYFAGTVPLSHWGLSSDAAIAGASRSLATTPLSAILHALDVLGAALAAAPETQRDAIATNLAGWARAGGREPWASLLAQLLTPSSGKQRRAA